MNGYDKKTQVDASILTSSSSSSIGGADTDVSDLGINKLESKDVLNDEDTQRQIIALPADGASYVPVERLGLAAFIAQKIEHGAFVARFEGASAQIVYANDDLANWLGQSPADLEGTPLNSWLHTTHQQRAFLTPAVISETRFEQVSFVGPEGESLWANVHVIPHPEEALTYACFVQDTKLKRELAREMLYVQQMKQRHSIWRDVSRDVLNPLASVQSNLNFAMESFYELNLPPMPEVLEAIEDAQKGLIRTIDTLQTLMFDKRATNKDEGTIESSSVDVPELIKSDVHEPKNLGVDILDPSKLSEFSNNEENAFNTMLDEAIEYVMAHTPKPAQVVKRIESNIQAENWAKPEMKKVVVDLLLYTHDMLRDGYDVELLAYTHDTNVCLSILFVNDLRDGDDLMGSTWGAHDLLGCHRTIMAKGGELNIEQDGPQQHISISLPKVVENAWRATSTADFSQNHVLNTLSQSSKNSTVQPKKTVLVVDDEAHVLTTISKILSATYDVVTAESISEAMEYIKTHDMPDAFVCDVLLTEGNGFELYGELVKKDRALRKRLLFMSDNTQLSWIHDTAKALKAPMLRKPFTSSQLLAEVGRLLPIS